MFRATTTMLVWLLAVALVGGCGRSKEDLVEKSRGASTRAELERALGKPSDIAKLGALALIGLAALTIMGQTASAPVANTIEAERFILRDASGHARASLGVRPDGT